MNTYFTILQLFLFLSIVTCDLVREKIKRKSKSIQWQKHPQYGLTAHNMNPPNKHDNSTRKVAAVSNLENSDIILEKLMDTITNSDKYLKKIESIDFRLNRLDIEFHDKTNSIITQLADLNKVVVSAVSGEKLDSTLHMMRDVLVELKSVISKPSVTADIEDHSDSPLDTRLTALEDTVKNIHSGVDSIVTTIVEVKNRQNEKQNEKTDAPSIPDSLALINEFRKALHDKRYKKCECNDARRLSSTRLDRSERYPTDCHEIQLQGFNVSGIYKIRPEDMNPFYVLCDLTTAGGGWTVFQNRFDGSQDFYKSWNDYENGFGNLAGEFWLGLEKLTYLTNQKLYELRVELECQTGQEAHAGYSVFTVGPQQEGYRISTLGSFHGNAGDSLSYHAGQKFSTYDMDNDEWRMGACATEHGGAWWYKECDKSNLNGKYPLTRDGKGASIYWVSFMGPNKPLVKTKMMIRPLPASKPVEYVVNDRIAPKEGKDLIDPVSQAKNMRVVQSHKKSLGPYESRPRSRHTFTNAPGDIFHNT